MLASLTEFIGHFHPLIVHLPIGFLLAGLLLQWLSYKEKYRSLQQAVAIVLLWGAITASIAAITGYLLRISDDYDKNAVNWHQWMGIGVAVSSWILYAKEKNPQWMISKKIIAAVLLLLIIITGHLGGSLTHGSDYLTRPLSDVFGDDSTSNTAIKPVPDVQEAVAYNDIIKPILQTKCYSCHGPNKQKGKLRMDDEQLLMKGGKDGKAIEPGNADQSEMIKRLLLPVDDQDHMPPKEKPQPTESQIALLHWWIGNGADFTKKVKDIPQTEKVKPLLLALQKAPEVKKDISFIPVKPVERGDDKIIDQLNKKGILVMPVAKNSNYLMANFVTHPQIDSADMQLLLSLRKQLIWLKLSYTNLTDSRMAAVGQLQGLTRLSLDHTKISDKGIGELKQLQNLQYLNVVATNVSAEGVVQLKKLKTLLSIFLYQTQVKKEDWPMLQKTFPTAQIDSGGYTVEMLATDTVEIKAKKY
ncbi:MAG: c-type cytochrome domain-containing protein [Chitinophagales bacterium]